MRNKRTALLLFAETISIVGVAGLFITPAYGRPCFWTAVYPFFHAGLWHLASSVMCLAAISNSEFRVPLKWIFAAYVTACAALPMTGHVEDTCGASGVIYALLGAMSWQSCNKLKFHATIAVIVLLTYALPVHVNVLLHVICYISGMAIGKIWRQEQQ